MKKSRIASFFLCCLSVISLTSANQKPNFTLNGKIKGLQTGKIVLSYRNGNIYQRDTARIKNGIFIFSGFIHEPTLASLSIPGVRFWLDPAKMNIDVNKDDSENFKLIGSKTQKEFELYEQSLLALTRNRDAVYSQMDSLNNIAAQTEDTIIINHIKEKLEQLCSQNELCLDRISNFKIDYIRTHTNSFISGDELFSLNVNDYISLDSSIVYYNRLSPVVQNSDAGKGILINITKMKNNQPGVPAPDFEAKDDIHNSVVRLSDFKGKVILMDFWAYFCGPCRRGFAYIKPLYNQFYNQGFDVIAVNTDGHGRDGDKSKWRTAIQEDSVAMWHHVQVAENFTWNTITDKDIYSKYFVQAIPRKILIDKKGIIRGNWCGFSERVEAEVKSLVEKLVNE